MVAVELKQVATGALELGRFVAHVGILAAQSREGKLRALHIRLRGTEVLNSEQPRQRTIAVLHRGGDRGTRRTVAARPARMIAEAEHLRPMVAVIRDTEEIAVAAEARADRG